MIKPTAKNGRTGHSWGLVAEARCDGCAAHERADGVAPAQGGLVEGGAEGLGGLGDVDHVDLGGGCGAGVEEPDQRGEQPCCSVYDN